MYDAGQARKVAEEAIRAEAASKNNPADLINVALEQLVQRGLELRRSRPWTGWRCASARLAGAVVMRHPVGSAAFMTALAIGAARLLPEISLRLAAPSSTMAATATVLSEPSLAYEVNQA